MPRRPPRPQRPASQKSLQRRGTLLALALGAGSVAIVGFFIIRGAQSPPPAPAPAAPTGIEIRPGDSLTPGESGGAKGLKITLMDKQNPGRRAGLVLIETLDPDPTQQFMQNATRPQAWVYLRDGRLLHIRADEGQLYMPDRRSAPESGSISGNVTIRTFEGRDDGQLPDLDTAAPLSTFSTHSIAFDSALGEAVSHDPFEYTHPGVAYLRATGFKVILNEAQQRLERLHISQGDRIALWQQERHGTPEQPAKAQTAAHPDRPAGSTTPPSLQPAKKPVETTYIMKFAGDVGVLQGTSRITDAESLQIWARFLDNKLPEDAIRQVRFQGSPERDGAATTPQTTPAAAIRPQTAPAEPTAQNAPQAPALAGTPDERPPDLVLQWSGPCTIDLAPAETPELKANHLAMRFASEQPGGVRYSESQQGFSGSAATIDYALTTAVLRLAGAQPESARGATLTAERGRLDVGALSYDLSTGIAHIPTGGLLAQSDTESIQWSRQADVQFELEDGAVTSNVRQASFQGDIRIAISDGSAQADFARADFARIAGRASSLARVLLQGAARITSRDEAYLRAERIDIPFAPRPSHDGGGSTPDPRMITATGNVEAGRDTQRLAADFLEAILARNPRNMIDAQSVLARGNIRFIDSDDHVDVASDELRADLSWTNRLAGGELAQKQVIDLTGRDVTLTKDGRTSIAGSQVRIDGVARSLQVFGAGRFQHSDAGERPLSVTATWSRGMMFDNVSGLVECDGDATAISDREDNQRDTLRSERLKLWIEPEGVVIAQRSGLESGEGERKLLKAEAIGGVLIKDGGGNASIESRQLIEDPAAPAGARTAQLYYLEGPRIIADRVAQTLHIPAAGRMLLLDQRPEDRDQPRQQQAAAFGPASSRGTALMDWDGQLLMDRNAGTMDARQNVRLTHRAADDTRTITNLLAERVIARIRELAGSTDQGLRAELVSATATGAVYVTSGPEITQASPRPQTKELVADQVDYNAVQRTLTATAAPGNQVSLFDPQHPVPATAASLYWDLTTDRVEIREPGPISAPRSTSSR